MALTDLEQKNIRRYVQGFKKYLYSADGKSDHDLKYKRISMLVQLLSLQGLAQMTDLEFGQVISSLWASAMWGNKGYLVDRLINDNGLDKIKDALRRLLWDDAPISQRYDTFRSRIKGFGPGMITEILAFTHPNEYGLWNNKARQALKLLGFENSFPVVKKSQITGREYERFNALLADIQEELSKYELEDIDVLGIDYFLLEVWKSGWEDRKLPATERIDKPDELTDFDHDEVVAQITAIGLWLGFEVHKEKPIAQGSKVDALWQARIANLGVVTYVFEVQRHGSIDSLLLNLQRAQNNPSVQRLVIVALPREIAKIKKEVETLHESFRRSVAYWEVSELLHTTELVTELSGIINKLELVKGEFERQE